MRLPKTQYEINNASMFLKLAWMFGLNFETLLESWQKNHYRTGRFKTLISSNVLSTLLTHTFNGVQGHIEFDLPKSMFLVERDVRQKSIINLKDPNINVITLKATTKTKWRRFGSRGRYWSKDVRIDTIEQKELLIQELCNRQKKNIN